MTSISIPRIAAVVLVLSFCCPYGTAQPPRPNLSGTWKLDGAKTRHPQWWHETRDYSCVIEHSEPKLSMMRISRAGIRTDFYMIDGKERLTHPPRDGNQLQAKSYWDGDTLVIESRRESRDLPVSVWTSRYQLSEDGKTLMVSEHFLKSSSSDKPFDVYRTFEKQAK